MNVLHVEYLFFEDIQQLYHIRKQILHDEKVPPTQALSPFTLQDKSEDSSWMNFVIKCVLLLNSSGKVFLMDCIFC